MTVNSFIVKLGYEGQYDDVEITTSLRYASIYCGGHGGHQDMSVDWADRFGSFRSLVRVDHVRSSDAVVGR